MKLPTCIQSITLALVLTATIPTLVSASEQPPDIPIILADMQQHTQEMIDALLIKNATVTALRFQQIKADVKQLRQKMNAGPYNERRSRELLMSYSWIRVIGIEVHDKAWIEAAVAANQLSAMLMEATEFPTLIHRDVAWLYYLGREVELLTLENPKANAELLDVRLITLENTWNRVRKELIKNFKNKPLVEQGNVLLTSLKHQPKQPPQLIISAKKLLLFIDQIRKKI